MAANYLRDGASRPRGPLTTAAPGGLKRLHRGVVRRWPAVGAAGPLLSFLAFRARGRLLPEQLLYLSGLPVLAFHQLEEWVWPGRFGTFMNRRVLGSPSDTAPLTPGRACVVNLYLGWGFSTVVAVAGKRLRLAPAALAGSHLSNVALHLGYLIRDRRYNPGVLTASLLLAPWSCLVLSPLPPFPRPPLPLRLLAAAGGAATLPLFVARLRREAAKARLVGS